ncbi:MAG: hypothetical protein WCK05_11005, partial [Planctomycetota bacterium]
MSLTQVRARHGTAILVAVGNCVTTSIQATRIRVAAATNVARQYPHEPDFVGQLLFDLPDLVNRRLAGLFWNCGVRIAARGVFVHKKPLVQYSNMPR